MHTRARTHTHTHTHIHTRVGSRSREGANPRSARRACRCARAHVHARARAATGGLAARARVTRARIPAPSHGAVRHDAPGRRRGSNCDLGTLPNSLSASFTQGIPLSRYGKRVCVCVPYSGNPFQLVLTARLASPPSWLRSRLLLATLPIPWLPPSRRQPVCPNVCEAATRVRSRPLSRFPLAASYSQQVLVG
jgi:hypothetical protein